jgi:hypothetical protein
MYPFLSNNYFTLEFIHEPSKNWGTKESGNFLCVFFLFSRLLDKMIMFRYSVVIY